MSRSKDRLNLMVSFEKKKAIRNCVVNEVGHKCVKRKRKKGAKAAYNNDIMAISIRYKTIIYRNMKKQKEVKCDTKHCSK